MKNLFFIVSLFLFSNLFAQNDGQIDSTFGVNGLGLSGFNSGGYSLSSMPDNQGNFIVVGQVSNSFNYNFAAVKFKSNGEIDSNFASNGHFLFDFGMDDFCTSVAIQQDNKIILGGYSETWDGINVSSIYVQFSFLRLNSNGALDTTYGNGGKVEINYSPFNCSATEIALQQDGKLVALGYHNGNGVRFCVIRLNTNGSLDSNFASNGIQVFSFDSIIQSETPTSLIIQPDQKILVGGYSIMSMAGNVFALARLNVDGSFDNSFGTGGKLRTDIPNQGNDYAASLAIQSDNKIIQAGTCKNNKIMAICRFNSDGTLDNTFSSMGIDTINLSTGNDMIEDVVVQTDEKLVLVGQSNDRACILRLNSLGQLDTSFNNTGVNYLVNSTGESFNRVFQINPSKLVASGFTKDSNNKVQFSLAAYNSILFSNINSKEVNINELKLFPNPTNGILNIDYTLKTNSKIQIQIINSLGQIVKEFSNQQTAGTYTYTVETKPYSNGIYYIRFSDGTIIKQSKVIIQ